MKTERTYTRLAVRLNGQTIALPESLRSAAEIQAGNPGSEIVHMTQSEIDFEFNVKQTNWFN